MFENMQKDIKSFQKSIMSKKKKKQVENINNNKTNYIIKYIFWNQIQEIDSSQRKTRGEMM